MAKKTVIEFIDDITGQPGEDVKTEYFVAEGYVHEIDLGPESRAQLEAAMKPFVEAGRRRRAINLSRWAEGSTGTSASRPTPIDREQNQAIRAWAAQQGMKVSDRGRIPANVLEAFHRSH